MAALLMGWAYPWMGGWLLIWLVGVGLVWRGHRQLNREIAEWKALDIEWTHALTPHRFRRSMIIWLLVSLCMIISSMGPRWTMTSRSTSPAPRHTTGEGLAIVIDTSLSMAAQDVAPSRLEMAIAWAQAEARQCAPCWVGLGSFEGIWDPLIPLTRDIPFLLTTMQTLQTAHLPIPGTELSNAVDVGIGLLAHHPGPKRILILSDGETHGPTDRNAIQDALSRGIRIDTVGIGTTDPTPMPTPNGPDPWKRTVNRELALTRFHAEPLQQLADQTGGQYRHHTTPPSASSRPASTIPAPVSVPKGPAPSFDWVLGLGMMLLMMGLRWK